MPRCNVKVPLNLWDSQDGYLTGVKSIIIDSIHKNEHLGVIINFTVSVFHQSTGNNILDLVQVCKLLRGEAPLITIIGEATQLDLKLGGHVCSSPRKENNSKPPTGENLVPHERIIRVNPNGWKQGGTPKKESLGIANPKGDTSWHQTELIPRCQ